MGQIENRYEADAFLNKGSYAHRTECQDRHVLMGQKGA